MQSRTRQDEQRSTSDEPVAPVDASTQRSDLVFPDADATVAEVWRWRRTGRLPLRLSLHPAWQQSRLATQIIKVLAETGEAL